MIMEGLSVLHMLLLTRCTILYMTLRIEVLLMALHRRELGRLKIINSRNKQLVFTLVSPVTHMHDLAIDLDTGT